MRSALIKTLAAAAALAALATGCSAGGSGATAGSAPPSPPPSSAPARNTDSPSPPAVDPTPTGTAPGIRGTATDFCSAGQQLAAGVNAARSPEEVVGALYGSAADLQEFAPAELQKEAEVFGDELKAMATNLAVGLYSSVQDLEAAMGAALASPSGVAISQYGSVHCQ